MQIMLGISIIGHVSLIINSETLPFTTKLCLNKTQYFSLSLNYHIYIIEKNVKTVSISNITIQIENFLQTASEWHQIVTHFFLLVEEATFFIEQTENAINEQISH